MIETTKAMLVVLRRNLDGAFAKDTAAGDGWNPLVPSSGHCAVVAMVVREVFGGEYASADVMSLSHWFNLLKIDGLWWDVDLTGDQFGRPPVQVLPAGTAYGKSRARAGMELNDETIRRYQRLLSRTP